MRQSFGKQLKNFALAVDIIDKDMYLDVRELILDYTRKVLDIDFTRQLIEANLDSNVALMPFGLAAKGKYNVINVYDSDEKPTTQAAYSYINNKSLWIVSGDSTPGNLSDCSQYKDLWCGVADDLPAYKYPVGERERVPIKTSILIPLRLQGRPFGVLNFETQDYLTITDEAKNELNFIAQAVAILYQGYLNFEENFARTREAFADLNNILSQPLPKLTKPKIFLASSTQAHGDVIEILMEVLEEYEEKFDMVYWKKMNQSGNINTQILKILGACRFGVCYISEPDMGAVVKEGDASESEKQQQVFRDNPNVIFEAGMLHGRSDYHLDFPASWIPVREGNSNITPFDFASERTIIVERNGDDTINVDSLKEQFKERLDGLLFYND